MYIRNAAALLALGLTTVVSASALAAGPTAPA
jgi:hypothetical protein